MNQSTFFQLFENQLLEQDTTLDSSLTEGHWFRLPSVDLGFKHLYGGQVYSQCIFLVAQLARDSHMKPHSCHCYFIRPGQALSPIDFQIIAIGQGRSFQRYQVVAYQGRENKGPVVIFRAIVSCQIQETGLINHQKEMPEVSSPEVCASEIDLRQALGLDVSLLKKRAIELRMLENAHQGFWFRYAWADEHISKEYTQTMLAYASDYGLIGSMLIQHGLIKQAQSLYLTSLDHSLWYYHDYNPHEWCFYDCFSPVAGGARGIVHGHLFQNGRLIAVATQEGLLRKRQ